MEGRDAEAPVALPAVGEALSSPSTALPPPPSPPPPPPPLRPPTTTLASLPQDLLGEILLRVPRPGPASLAQRSLAAVLSERTFRHRHRHRHRSARRQLGAWAMADQGGMAMAMAMAAYAVAVRDRARHRAAGVEWVPPPTTVAGGGGGGAPSMRVAFVPVE